MKIIPTHGGILPPTTKNSATPTANPSGSFSSVLEQVVQQRSGSTIWPAGAPNPLSSLPPAAIEPFSGVDSMVGQTDRLLDALENYATQLDNPQASMRDIYPIAVDLRNRIGDLEDCVRDMDAEHPVRRIADQALLTATLELSRFDSGHYVED